MMRMENLSYQELNNKFFRDRKNYSEDGNTHFTIHWFFINALIFILVGMFFIGVPEGEGEQIIPYIMIPWGLLRIYWGIKFLYNELI